MRDLHHSIGASTALAPQTITTAAVDGAIIDVSGFDSLSFVVTSGTVTDGTSYTASLTEGDAANLSDGTTVAAGDILGTLPVFAAADDNTTKRCGYVGNCRYVRLTLTPVGATSGGVFSAVAVQGHPASAPVA
jgi:hypothetical protein